MQEQAAPPRFRGQYPHEMHIPTAFIPHDAFVLDALKKTNTLVIDPNHEILSGNFPKLIMDIRDPEIRKLAGEGFENFDNIDCKDISCTCQDKPRYMQLFQSTVADRDSIIYNPCKRTLFAAAKRQVKSAPVPDLDVLNDFLGFAKQTIDIYLKDELINFGYSYNQWYNHLTYSKQKRMDAIHEFIHGSDPLKEHFVSVDKTNPKMFHYEAICKMEIQGTDGKPRMVCSIPDIIKYVMGPVCWKLEEIFAHKVPTYCGGKNLGEMEKQINDLIDQGFCIVAEGDGSSFDNSQDVLLKSIDRHIYNMIADRVHHVPRELFLYVANAFYKVMDIVQVEGKSKTNLMTYAVLGTVFSGDCDTTLMNTLRMGLYNWYTNYKAHLQIGIDFTCFSKGDDFTVMYKRLVDMERIKRTYKNLWLGKFKPESSHDGCDERIYGLGQILKFIEFGPPNSIKFCSLRAWYTDYFTQHIHLTRDPGKFTTLAKYSRKALHMSDARLKEYLIDQAVSLETTCNNINYFHDMAVAYRELANSYGPLDLSKGARAYKAKDRRTTLDLEVSDPGNGYLYTPREESHKIVGTYWETMKELWLTNESSLSPEQWRVVNQQIDSEFADRPISLLTAA